MAEKLQIKLRKYFENLDDRTAIASTDSQTIGSFLSSVTQNLPKHFFWKQRESKSAAHNGFPWMTKKYI